MAPRKKKGAGKDPVEVASELCGDPIVEPKKAPRRAKAPGLVTVVSSDWHLDWNTAGVSRFNDVTLLLLDELMGAITRFAVDGPTRFVFLGDLCEDQPGRVSTSGAILRALEFANHFRHRLAMLEVESIWVQGNHDVAEDGSGASTVAAVASGSLSPSCCRWPGRWPGCDDLFFLPYTASSDTYSPAEVVKKAAGGVAPRAVFGHLNVEGITPGSEATDMPRGRDVFWPLAELRATWPGAKLIGGHIHRQMRWGVETAQPLAIVGAPARFTFGEETNSPGYLVLGADGDVQMAPFRETRRLATVEVSGADVSLARAAKQLKAAGDKGQLVRVRYTGPPERAQVVEDELREHAAAVKVVREDAAPTQVAQPRTEPRRGVRAAVLEVAERVVSADKPTLLKHVGERLDGEGVA